MKLNLEILQQTLPMLVKGMAGIFIVTFIIIACVQLLNRLLSNK